MAIRLTVFSRILIVALILGLIYFFIRRCTPELKVLESKALEKINISDREVNNVSNSTELPIPSTGLSDKNFTHKTRIAGYAWNAQSGIIAANGGANTTKGSIMESQGVNLEIIRQDWLTELRNLQLKFIEEYDNGKKYPSQGVFAVMIMGDGAPYYISSTQQALNDKYGKGKYNLQVIGCIGLSYGEDKLIGPPKWKLDPQSMKGSLISTVLGDGDWVTSVNYAFANGLKVNPDPGTYDEEAVNFYPSANDDYIESAKELIKSQSENWSISLKEIKNGKLTGKIINKKIDGCATWTPGDKLVFDALSGFTDIVSTREFNNQMAVTLIGLKEWSLENKTEVANILKASFMASNQIKLFESWKRFASEAVASTYQLENANYWYDMFKGTKGEKNGLSYNMGGSRVFNLADAKQYYGLSDGVNRYKAVYDQVSNYLKQLNPAGFNQNVKNIVAYDAAVNLDFIQNISNIEQGDIYASDYSKKASKKLAKGEWNINFNSGRASLRPEATDLLNQIYNILLQAEDTKIEIVGHTDNIGSFESNIALSSARAEAVKTYFIGKGIVSSRFQKVEGKGSELAIADNSTESGRAKNRRVEITLLK